MRSGAQRVRARKHRADGFVGGFQTLDGDAFGLACLDDALLIHVDALHNFRGSAWQCRGDPDDPVLVSVQQVAWIDPHAPYLHRVPELTKVCCQGVRACLTRGTAEDLLIFPKLQFDAEEPGDAHFY